MTMNAQIFIHRQMSLIVLVLDASKWMGVLAYSVRTAFQANATAPFWTTVLAQSSVLVHVEEEDGF